MRNLLELPDDLPVPLDDGGAAHLEGMALPDLNLVSTQGTKSLREIFSTSAILFIYPRAGSPLEPNTNQELWDSIPGARGCTPQSCAFRDAHEEFQDLGVSLFALSVQKPDVQLEFANRNHINFPILSDEKYEFTEALNLPTFEFEGDRLIKRMSLFINHGKILKVFYPIFPPNKNAELCLEWLKSKGTFNVML